MPGLRITSNRMSVSDAVPDDTPSADSPAEHVDRGSAFFLAHRKCDGRGVLILGSGPQIPAPQRNRQQHEQNEGQQRQPVPPPGRCHRHGRAHLRPTGGLRRGRGGADGSRDRMRGHARRHPGTGGDRGRRAGEGGAGGRLRRAGRRGKSGGGRRARRPPPSRHLPASAAKRRGQPAWRGGPGCGRAGNSAGAWVGGFGCAGAAFRAAHRRRTGLRGPADGAGGLGCV